MQKQGLVKPELETRGGVLRVVSNSELDRHAQATLEYEQAEKKHEQVVDSLAGHVRKLWQAAYQAKIDIDNRLLACLRQRKGEYDPEKLAMIREQGGSEVYVMLTNIKARAAESWINDILFQPGEKPWDIDPTPIPDLRPEIVQRIQERVAQEAVAASQFAAQAGLPPLTEQKVAERVKLLKDELLKEINGEAQRRADAMELKIEDQLVDAEWEVAMQDFIKDLTTYPLAILRGPVFRRHKTLKWEAKGGKWMPVIGSEIRMHFYRVSPFDFYPAPNMRDVNHAYLFERHRLFRSELVAMKKTPGVKDAAVDRVLAMYGNGGLRQWMHNDDARAKLEGRPNETMSDEQTIDALEFSGKVSGKRLIEWGMPTSEIPDPSSEYECNAWLIGTEVIKCVLNDNLLDKRDYHVAAFERVAGSIWGTALPELMSDAQDICNACARAIVNNMGMASGPMIEIHTDRLPAGEDVEDVRPWRLYQTKSDPNGTNNPAVRFYQPSLNVDPLLKVYQHFTRIADEHTGIPAYTHGDQAGGGAADTASGLSMLMGAASRGIKLVIRAVDKAIGASIKMVYQHNMLFEEDESIKGDLQVRSRGASSLIVKEQKQVRLNEMLTATNNPVDMNIIGQDGRATLLREAMKALDVVVDEVVPDDEEMRKRIMSSMQQQLAIEGRGPSGEPRTLDNAGNPVSGQDAATFQQG